MVRERDVSLRHIPNVSMSFQTDIASTSFPGDLSDSFDLANEDPSFQIPTSNDADLLLDVDDDFFRVGRDPSMMATPARQDNLTLSQLTPSPLKDARKLIPESTPFASTPRRSPRKHHAVTPKPLTKAGLVPFNNEATPKAKSNERVLKPNSPLPSPSRFDSLRAEVQTFDKGDIENMDTAHLQETPNIMDDSPDSSLALDGAASRLLMYGNALRSKVVTSSSQKNVLPSDAVSEEEAVVPSTSANLTLSTLSPSQSPPSPARPATKRRSISEEIEPQDDNARPRKRVHVDKSAALKPKAQMLKKVNGAAKNPRVPPTTRALPSSQRATVTAASSSSASAHRPRVVRPASSAPKQAIAERTKLRRGPVTQRAAPSLASLSKVEDTSKCIVQNPIPPASSASVVKPNIPSSSFTFSKSSSNLGDSMDFTMSDSTATTSLKGSLALVASSSTHSKSANNKSTRRFAPSQDLGAVKAKMGLAPTVPIAPNFSTDSRVRERREFEERLKEKEREMERIKEEGRQAREEAEERELRELRKRTVIKAHEVPEWYKDVPKKKGEQGI